MKIRAWDVTDKCWIPEDCLAITAKGELLTYEPDEDRWAIDIICSMLCRSIDLRDKNGKEIFEGDIVKTVDSFGSRNGKVAFEPRMMSWYIEYIASAQFGGRNMFESAEIIGNIYENSEFLTQ